MKLYCISDDVDTAVGLKLTGIKSVILKNNEEIELFDYMDEESESRKIPVNKKEKTADTIREIVRTV